MCGIVGYVGPKKVVPVIIEGLRRLEYRGYDSAGIAVGSPSRSTLEVRRAPGKLATWKKSLRQHPLEGTYGIGHTRWATHGRPTEENAHPHRDCTGRIVVVHNGIVENYLELKHELTAQGHKFVTETDTEIIAHLIEQVSGRGGGRRADCAGSGGAPRRQAAHRSLCAGRAFGRRAGQDRGRAHRPARGHRRGRGRVLSSPPTFPAFCTTRATSIFWPTATWPFSPPAGVELPTSTATRSSAPVTRILWDPIQAEKGGYKHFMLKEICEQPRAVRDTTLGRVSLDSGKVFLDEMEIADERAGRASSINIAACGTSWHAALAGKYMIERLARLPVEVDYASEYPLSQSHRRTATRSAC